VHSGLRGCLSGTYLSAGKYRQALLISIKNDKTKTPQDAVPALQNNILNFMQLSTTPVPNIIFDFYLSDLKVADLKVLLIIIRQTLGWKDNYTKSKRKERDWISGSQLVLKTGCSQRAINAAIQSLVQKKIITVLSEAGDLLDTPEKRRGQQKLFYCLPSAIISLVENEGKESVYHHIFPSANANFAGDFCKNLHELTQKLHITK